MNGWFSAEADFTNDCSVWLIYVLQRALEVPYQIRIYLSSVSLAKLNRNNIV